MATGVDSSGTLDIESAVFASIPNGFVLLPFLDNRGPYVSLLFVCKVVVPVGTNEANQVCGCRPVILATQEAKAGRSQVQGQPGQLSKTLI